MNENERATHFQKFAELLYEELAHNVVFTKKKHFVELEAFKQEQYVIIAKRAYDLVLHTLSEMDSIAVQATYLAEFEEVIETLPDFTEFPPL